MYQLEKIEGSEDKHTLGVKVSHGRSSVSIIPNLEEYKQGLIDGVDVIHEPTIGSMIFVETLREVYRTNVVTSIRSDTTSNDIRTIVFETASGSTYKWTADEL